MYHLLSNEGYDEYVHMRKLAFAFTFDVRKYKVWILIKTQIKGLISSPVEGVCTDVNWRHSAYLMCAKTSTAMFIQMVIHICDAGFKIVTRFCG